MNKNEDFPVELEITSPQQEKINQLKELFPEIMQDGAVNVGVLKDILGGENIVGDTSQPNTKYGLYWYGKNKAKEIANKSTRNTLVPQKDLSVNFEDTENLLIEGDNLEVLKLLQRTHMGKVDVIYIDPPYNTGNDFVYEDDFNNPIHGYLEQTGQLNEAGQKTSTDSETSGRKHANWLNMMYPRLKVARGLLSNEGVVFISIDDNEVSQLKIICDEIFGEDNFIGELIHQRAKGGGQAKYIVKGHDYILVYAKNLSNSNVSLKREKVVQGRTLEKDGIMYLVNDDVIRKQFGKYDKSLGDRRCFYEELVKYKGAAKKEEVDKLLASGELFLEENKDGLHVICKLEPVDGASSKLYSIIRVLSEEGKKELEELGVVGFDYPKPTELLKQLIKSATFENGKSYTVLDFFAGSGSTAHAVMSLNKEDGIKRKYILVQIPELILDKRGSTTEVKTNDGRILKTIADITRERILKAEKSIGIESGVKLFKLSESNYTINRKFDEEGGISSEELLAKWKKELENPLVEGCRAIDVLYENMLREGYDLNSKVKPTNDDGIAYDVVEEFSDGTKRMLVCKLDKIDEKEVERMEALVTSGDYKSITFVCLDKYLDDTQKRNLGSLLKLKTI